MKRIRLTVAYDGTNYSGWQVQNNGVTIEGELNKALSELVGEDIKVEGASRTDAGVHADGNVAIFDTDTPIPAEKIAMALNSKLPEDIVVVKSEEVDSDWHPRFSASTKTYEYTILNRRMPDPIRRKYATHIYYNLDVELMREAAKYLVGEHDFASFCSAGSQVLSTVRKIYSVDVLRDNDEIKIIVSGAGFLYNMVRIIAGTLIEVGNGRIKPSAAKSILEGKDRSLAGDTAPAHGLKLVKIEYK